MDVAAFCKSAELDEIKKHGYNRTPGRYVGAAEAEADREAFDKKMQRLTADLRKQFAEAEQLKSRIMSNLETLGY